MRRILLASTAFVLAGASAAFAVEPPKSAQFTVTSTLAASCSIGTGESTEVVVGPAASVVGTGEFTTTCNFEDADMTVSFVSDNGGVENGVEDITVDYTIAYGGDDALASEATLATPFEVAAASGPVAGAAIDRSFTVTLVDDITVAGDYTDTLTVTVAP